VLATSSKTTVYADTFSALVPKKSSNINGKVRSKTQVRRPAKFITKMKRLSGKRSSLIWN
jgi:hypothetical protein